MANKPTHILKMQEPDVEKQGETVKGKYVQVGAAWENSKGGFNIRLNFGTTLDWKDLKLEGYKLTLWPAKEDDADVSTARARRKTRR